VQTLEDSDVARLAKWREETGQKSRGRFESAVFSLNPTAFGVSTSLIFGFTNTWSAGRCPSAPFRPRKLHVNVRDPGLVHLTVVKKGRADERLEPSPVGSMFTKENARALNEGESHALLGGVTDAVTFGFKPDPLLKDLYDPHAHGAPLSLPLLLPTDALLVSGDWTDYTPLSRMMGTVFLLCLDFEGLQWVP
jgi:hypothetical protein